MKDCAVIFVLAFYFKPLFYQKLRDNRKSCKWSRKKNLEILAYFFIMTMFSLLLLRHSTLSSSVFIVYGVSWTNQLINTAFLPLSISVIFLLIRDNVFIVCYLFSFFSLFSLILLSSLLLVVNWIKKENSWAAHSSVILACLYHGVVFL